MSYANEVDIEAFNTASFVWAQDISLYLGVYPLQSGFIRAQIRTAATDPEPLIELNLANGGAALSVAGAVATLTLQMPLATVESLSGQYVYDVRFEYQGSLFFILFGGTLTFDQGVTRVYGDNYATPENVPTLAYVAQTTSMINALLFG
jgi:hypothetical protein